MRFQALAGLLPFVDGAPMRLDRGREQHREGPDGRVMLFTSARCDRCARQRRILDGLSIDELRRIELADVSDHPSGTAELPRIVAVGPDGEVRAAAVGMTPISVLRSLLDAADSRWSWQYDRRTWVSGLTHTHR